MKWQQYLNEIHIVNDTNSLDLLPETYAAWEIIARAYVHGTYNQKIAKAYTWWLTYVLAVPTIINWDLTLRDIEEIITNQRLVFDGYNNLPWQYEDDNFKVDGWFNFVPSSSIMVYSWSMDELKNSEASRIWLLSNVQDVYQWTILETEDNYNQLIITGIDLNSPSWDAQNLVWSMLNYAFGIDIPLTEWWLWSCAAQPWISNASFVSWNPIWVEQAWQNISSWDPCYYECVWWYSWVDCSIPPWPYGPHVIHLERYYYEVQLILESLHLDE